MVWADRPCAGKASRVMWPSRCLTAIRRATMVRLANIARMSGAYRVKVDCAFDRQCRNVGEIASIADAGMPNAVRLSSAATGPTRASTARSALLSRSADRPPPVAVQGSSQARGRRQPAG